MAWDREEKTWRNAEEYSRGEIANDGILLKAWLPAVRKGLHLTENVDKDKSKRDEMRQKIGGGSGVPVIDIEGTIIRGFNAGAIKAALDQNAR